MLRPPRTLTRKGDTFMTDVETAAGGTKATPVPKAIAAGLAFSGLANVRTAEVTLRWSGFQTAIQLNLVGLVGTMLWMLDNRTGPELSLVLFGCVAFVFWNIFHYKLLGRDGKFLGLWNEKLIELERTNSIEGGVEIFTSD